MVVAGAAALAEKVPDPELRPHGFAIEKGGLIDLEETAAQLVACGYERVDQVEDRGQFAIRGDILDVYPATEERAVRCELFDVEVERLTFFSTFTQRSLEEADRVEIAPAAEIGPEHRELAEMAALEEDEAAPRRGRGAAGGPLLRRAFARPARRARGRGRRGGDRALARRLLGGRHDELPRRGRPPPLRVARHAARRRSTSAPRCACRASRRTSRTSSAPRAPTPRAQPARGRARAGEARALRLPHGGRVVAAGRGRARGLQPGPAARGLPERPAGAARARRHVRRRQPARGLPRARA